MIKAVTKEIVKEVEELVRNRSDLLKVSANSDLIDFCWTVISEKLKQKVPILFKILNNVMLEKSKNSIYLLTDSPANKTTLCKRWRNVLFWL